MAFHGRESELAALLAAVSEHRLVTVTGPVGVGKTRLVREAREALTSSLFADVRFHSLDEVPPGSDAVTIAGHLGRSSAEGLALKLASDDELLVLDGCDHVAAGTVALVGDLLAADDAVSVVVTSRGPLHLAGEHVQVIAPFPVPDLDDENLAAAPPIALFVARSRAAGADWPLDGTVLAEVAGLCRELDGLPLAIELAAARSRVLSPVDLRRALLRKLDLFDSRPAPAGGRLGTVRAALEVSVDQLDGHERGLLRRLAVLPAAFDVETAHAVAGTANDLLGTVNALDILVDRSLLLVENTRSVSRYRMLGVVREMAVDGLTASGEMASAGDRFAGVMAELADRLVADGLRRWSGEVVAAIATRVSDLLAAVEWCVENDDSPDRALRTFLPLFGGVHQSRSGEVRRCGERLFARWPIEAAPLRAECLAVLATGSAIASDGMRARELAAQALADPAVTAVGRVVAHRAWLLADLAARDLDDALAQARAGEEAASVAGMDPFARELRAFRASIIDQLGRPSDGLTLAVEVAVEAEAADDAVTELWARVVAANISARSGDWAEVRRQVSAASVASAAAETENWTASVFRSATLLGGYDAMATAHLDGWAASVPAWRQAVLGAAARGGAPEVAMTVRAAATVAGHMGQDRVASGLAEAVPATDELSVLPDVFDEPPSRPRRRLPLPTALQAALDVLDSHDALGSLGPSKAAAANLPGLLRRDGDTWEIAYAGATARIRHLKGIGDLASLVGRPNTEVHVLELMGVVQVSESTGPAIDDKARQSYRTQVLDLQEEIDEARAANDLARAERAEDELDALVAELSATLGLGGRSRETGSTVERARSAVTFRVRAAIKRIGEHHDLLGRHLRNSVRTGTWCSYAPEHPVAWEVDPG